MIIFKNINRTDEYIEADYYPEGEDSFGHIKLDMNDDSILEKVIAKADKSERYFSMARFWLRDHKRDEPLHETNMMMWY